MWQLRTLAVFLCVGLALCSVFNEQAAQKPVRHDPDAIEGKKDVNEELKTDAAGLKDGCFPRPSNQGCRCTEKDSTGHDVAKTYDTDADCRIGAVNRKRRFTRHVTGEPHEHHESAVADEHPADGEVGRAAAGGAAETDDAARKPRYPPARTSEAAPAPGGDATAREAAGGGSGGALSSPAAQAKETEAAAAKEAGAAAETVDRKRRDVAQQHRERPMNAHAHVKPGLQDPPSQNVRDPVREKAAQNYQAVLNELKDKFRGLKEGCFPRPKGCLCVIGKDADGRDRTERRMKDADCKCQPGERGPACPAA